MLQVEVIRREGVILRKGEVGREEILGRNRSSNKAMTLSCQALVSFLAVYCQGFLFIQWIQDRAFLASHLTSCEQQLNVLEVQ